MAHDPYLAWVVENSEAQAVVVFATSERNARSIASEELGCAMTTLTAKRAPRLDHEAPGPISAHNLLFRYHWALACHLCGGLVRQTSEQLMQAITDGPLVFCDKTCAKHYLAVADDLAEDLKQARTRIFSLCPDVRFTRWWLTGEEGAITYQFFIPGSLHVALWRESKPNNIFCVEDDLHLVDEVRVSRRLH